MKVILSIKPEFASKIFDGTKSFEFRRTIFKNQEVNTVIVYASSPVCKVIGEFTVKRVHKQNLGVLWEQTKHSSGIAEAYFLEYFQGKDYGYAIEISNPTRYDEAQNLQENFGIKPPQSFAYYK